MPITLKIQISDITSIKADAIVNSANVSLRKGSGMCRSIYQKAGENRLDDYFISNYGKDFKLNPGEALASPGFNLSAKYIIHTVTPKYYLGSQDVNIEIMSCCYAAILELAMNMDVMTLAIPCLGVGHHGWPVKLSTSIAVDTIKWISNSTERNLNIIFCCYTKEQYNHYQDYITNCKDKSNEQ